MSTTTPANIAERAYFIWEQTGRSEGNALENWLQAEAELAAARPSEFQSSPAITPAEKTKRRVRRKS